MTQYIFSQERWDCFHPDFQEALEDDPNVEVIING